MSIEWHELPQVEQRKFMHREAKRAYHNVSYKHLLFDIFRAGNNGVLFCCILQRE